MATTKCAEHTRQLFCVSSNLEEFQKFPKPINRRFDCEIRFVQHSLIDIEFELVCVCVRTKAIYSRLFDIFHLRFHLLCDFIKCKLVTDYIAKMTYKLLCIKPSDIVRPTKNGKTYMSQGDFDYFHYCCDGLNDVVSKCRIVFELLQLIWH